jgi:hypothetical protein
MHVVVRSLTPAHSQAYGFPTRTNELSREGRHGGSGSAVRAPQGRAIFSHFPETHFGAFGARRPLARVPAQRIDLLWLGRS